MRALEDRHSGALLASSYTVVLASSKFMLTSHLLTAKLASSGQAYSAIVSQLDMKVSAKKKIWAKLKTL